MKGISSYNLALHFEKIIVRIFESYNFTVKLLSNISNSEYDILAKDNDKNYFIEVKFSRTNRIPTSTLFDVAYRLKKLANINPLNPSIPILILGAQLEYNIRKKIEGIGVTVIDIENLLFLVQNNDSLKRELLSILDFSVNELLPKKPKTSIFDKKIKFIKPSHPQGILLKKRICDWETSNGNTAYENLCFETLNYLFDNELALWHKQKVSNAELYRFDLICKIKDGDVSGLWSTILQCFNSKYIIFEFKNYTDKITQKEIYTTDKYLYLKALRGVAILISCKGASENANKAIRGTLRENGKLILSISNEDLIKMIDIKINEGIPADYLYSKFDELLIELEK